MSTTLRIAHLDTEKTWRGGENQVLLLVDHLRRRGHHMISLVRRGSLLGERLRLMKIPTYEMRPVFEWDVFCAVQISRLLRREKIDVLHAHTSHATALAAMARWFNPLPTLTTRRVDFHLNKNPFTLWKYSQMDRVIAISQAVKNILLADGINENKITVVPSGVEIEEMARVIPYRKEELGFPADCVLLGQVAALADHKDQETFLQAIAILKRKVPALKVSIVGEGPLRSRLKKRALQLGVDDIVTFWGFRKDVLRMLSGFDFFCLSSKEEGLGTSLINAMLLRIPVIATRAGGIPELIEEGRTGFIAEPQNPQALAAVLERVLTGKAPVHKLVDNAYQKALGFDVAEAALKMEHVYEELATARPSHN